MEEQGQGDSVPASRTRLSSGGSAILVASKLLPSHVASNESITEKLVSLDVSQHKKSMLLRPPRLIPGYPKCVDPTVGYPECLPPGEIVRRAIAPEQLWGIPVNKPLTKEQLIDLMKQMGSYPTNDYLYLSHVYPLKTLEFNPYLFKIVQYKDIDPNNHFTLSKSGLMRFQKGMAEFTDMVKFTKQLYIYDRLRQVPFLMLYPMYKSFRIWRANICQSRMKKNRKLLEESLFTTKRPLRGLLTLLFRMIEKISEMGFLSFVTTSTYDVKDFVTSQENRLEIILKRFEAFEKMVVELTENACRTYLVDCGFSADHYEGEVKFYLKSLTIPVEDLNDEVSNFMDYPGQWLPYSLQAKKRRICGRLSNFIHLVDYYVQAAYHRVLKRSVLQLMVEFHARTKLIPGDLGGQLAYFHTYSVLRKKNEALHGKIASTDTTAIGPIFELGCSYNVDGITFNPPQNKFLKHIQTIFNIWKNVVCGYKNLLPDETFNPYTQPIVNGYMEAKTCGDGPNVELHYNTDPDLFEVEDTIEAIINHAFHACKQYVDSFDSIRQFCLENDTSDFEKTITEIENVNELMKLMDKYHKQLKQVEEMEKEKVIGIFLVNNEIFRENVTPSVMRVIDVLHDHIPKVGRKLLWALTLRIEEAEAKIAKYPETAEEYAEYLLFLDDIQKQMDDIERELDDCGELADMIETYKMETTEDETQGYANLVPLLNKLRGDIEDHLENREKVITELLEQFEIFRAKVFSDLEEIRTLIHAPNVLDAKSDTPSMKLTMQDCKDLLESYVERAAKFNNYQKQLELEVTDYSALDELNVEVKLRHQLWESMFNWDVQKEAWDNSSFAILDHAEMTNEVNKYIESIRQLDEGLPPNDVVPILRTKVEYMKTQISLVSLLHNPHLKDRHFAVLEERMNFKVTGDEPTLKSLNEAGLESFTDFIKEISDQATSEYNLGVDLSELQDSWKNTEFGIIAYKNQRGIFILGGIEEIKAKLQDTYMGMESIANSPFVEPIHQQLEEWVALMDLFSKTLTDWLICQQRWIQLEGIFSAPEIQRQFPVEDNLFAQVDKRWVELMRRTNKMPVAIRAAMTPGLLDQIKLNIETMDEITSSLEEQGFTLANLECQSGSEGECNIKLLELVEEEEEEEEEPEAEVSKKPLKKSIPK